MEDAPSQGRSIRERLDELYRRLRLLPRARTADDALQQLCDTLDAVEDAWSGIPKKSPPPLPSEADGRMYCPMTDYVSRLNDGGILALTRGHRIEIGVDGSLRIVSKITGQPEFEK
jgi:hypothetical protein